MGQSQAKKYQVFPRPEGPPRIFCLLTHCDMHRPQAGLVLSSRNLMKRQISDRNNCASDEYSDHCQAHPANSGQLRILKRSAGAREHLLRGARSFFVRGLLRGH